jgi:hypothetical protein
MARKKSERVTIRLSSKENIVLSAIQKSGDFEDKSTTIRFCINLSSAILKSIPASIGESFVEIEEAALAEVEAETEQ